MLNHPNGIAIITIELRLKQNITFKGILFNGFLIPKLLYSPLASCSLINLDLLVWNIAHFDNSIVLLLLVFKILGFMFSVFFYTLNNMIALLYTYVFV